MFCVKFENARKPNSILVTKPHTIEYAIGQQKQQAAIVGDYFEMPANLTQ